MIIRKTTKTTVKDLEKTFSCVIFNSLSKIKSVDMYLDLFKLTNIVDINDEDVDTKVLIYKTDDLEIDTRQLKDNFKYNSIMEELKIIVKNSFKDDSYVKFMEQNGDDIIDVLETKINSIDNIVYKGEKYIDMFNSYIEYVASTDDELAYYETEMFISQWELSFDLLKDVFDTNITPKDKNDITRKAYVNMVESLDVIESSSRHSDILFLSFSREFDDYIIDVRIPLFISTCTKIKESSESGMLDVEYVFDIDNTILTDDNQGDGKLLSLACIAIKPKVIVPFMRNNDTSLIIIAKTILPSKKYEDYRVINNYDIELE